MRMTRQQSTRLTSCSWPTFSLHDIGVSIMRIAREQRRRRGNIIVLASVSTFILVGMVAFSVDIGYAFVQRGELQRCADAAAISATSDLLDQQLLNPTGTPNEAEAVATAVQFAALNGVGRIAPYVPPEDIEVGALVNSSEPGSTIVSGTGFANAARVRVQRTLAVNGETPYFFAPIFGHSGVAQDATSTAVYLSSFRGFRAPPDGSNLGILPFTLDYETWQELKGRFTTDEWTWDADTKTILPGPDGVFEANLFPLDTGMPGNRGTVDIGHSGNSTSDIKRQILDGISPSDLEHHGGKLELDSNGELLLNGDTGISAAVKAELESIKGEPRIIPIFEDAAGNGNNANYTITQFVGVRIMEVKLTGKMSKKRVIIQPAGVRMEGGIPDDGIEPTTFYIFSNVRLAR